MEDGDRGYRMDDVKDDWSRPLLIGLPQIRTGPLDGRLVELERVDPHLGYEPQMTGAS